MRRYPFGPRNGLFCLIGALAAAFLAGCGSGGLQTHSVNGRVVMDKGDIKPLVGASVDFVSAADPTTHAYGEIQEDGSFTLKTYKQGVLQSGAVEGEHRVRIVLPENEDDPDAPRPRVVDPRFLAFDSSGLKCTVPVADAVVFKVSP